MFWLLLAAGKLLQIKSLFSSLSETFQVDRFRFLGKRGWIVCSIAKYQPYNCFKRVSYRQSCAVAELITQSRIACFVFRPRSKLLVFNHPCNAWLLFNEGKSQGTSRLAAFQATAVAVDVRAACGESLYLWPVVMVMVMVNCFIWLSQQAEAP